MPKLIASPTRITAAGNKPKLIDEFVGHVNSAESRLSVAHMRSPGGWMEPGQTPEFDEFTIVLKGMLRVEFQGGTLEVRPGQAIHTAPGEWIRYSTPEADGIHRGLPAGVLSEHRTPRRIAVTRSTLRASVPLPLSPSRCGGHPC